MFIAYKPELSFYGTLHWEMQSGEPAVHGLSASYIENAPTAVDDGWIYASVGDTYSELKPVALDLDLASGRLVGLNFWFSCYYTEDNERHRYRYKVNVYNHRQPDHPFQFYALDVSRNGYLAVYKDSDLQRVHAKSPWWELEGVDPLDIKQGTSHANITLISPSGKPVRRKMEDSFPYLNDQDGHDARFTINVIQHAKRQPW